MRIKVHRLIAALVFISGLINITSAFFARAMDRLAILRSIFPLEILHASRSLSLVTGIYLIYLSKGLLEKKQRAWLLAVITIAISFWLHLIKGLDFEEAIFSILPLWLLLANRPIFIVQSGPLTTFAKIKRSILLISVLAAFLILMYFGLIPVTRLTRELARSADWLILIAGLSAVWSIFAPLTRTSQIEPAALEAARQLVVGFGRTPSSYLTLMDDKRHFFSASGKSFIAYGVKNGVAVALGGPIGEPDARDECLTGFLKEMERRGLIPAFINLNRSEKSLFTSHHFKFLQFGEEAIIDANDFRLEQPELKDVRNSVNRMNRSSINFNWYNLKEIPWFVVNEVSKLHFNWLQSKPGPTLTFSVDFFPLPPEKTAWLLTAVDLDDQLFAAFSFFPYDRGRSMGLELMLRRPNGPNGLAEAMIAEAVRYFQVLGRSRLSLGVALKNIRLSRFYGFQSLFAFKNKFRPLWQPRYLGYLHSSQIPKILVAIVEVHTAKGGKDWNRTNI